MQEELARGFGQVVLDIAKAVFVDMRVVKKGLVVFDAGEGVAKLSFAGTKGLTSVPLRTMPASKVSRM